jgi:hypothetical protein
MLIRTSLFAAAACLAFGQGSISGPSLGIFFDPQAQSLRKISGIPGSAVAGDNLNVGFSVAKALVAPGQDYALALSTDGTVNLVSLSTSGIAAQVITALSAAPDQIVLSPNARAAAFTYGTSVQVVSGLPNSLDVTGHFDLSALASAPGNIAISDDGTVLLVSSRDATSPGGVFVFSGTDGTPRLVGAGNASGLMFLPDSHDGLIVDENAKTVTALQDIGGGAAPLWIFQDDRLGAPRLARGSKDGRNILVASSNNNTAAVLDRNGGNAVFIPCTCSPTEIEPLSGAVYQITDSAAGLMWILDLTSEPRIFFVPVSEHSSDPQ